ncbi:MAG: glycosyltransferase family 4 protein [Cyclobacteriaceae bacterium]|nr:glycosyltransferase family 4 protein [Cyclobacteriaceae bacterium]
MKKVLYIHQYFKTPEEGGALRSFYIAKGLVERGHQVDLITGHNEPELLVKSIEGINVHSLAVFYENKLSTKSRYIAFLKFAVKAIQYSGKIVKPDIAYVTSTPLTVGIIALWLKWMKRVPYIFEVRDLWPAAPIELGFMKSGIIQQLAFWLEKTIYKNAAHLVALSPGIMEVILEKYQNARVTVIPNMADISYYGEKAVFFHKHKNLVIGYFGAMGVANGLMAVTAVAEICQQQDLPIQFILMGEGSEREKLEQAVADKKLRNIELFPREIKTK